MGDVYSLEMASYASGRHRRQPESLLRAFNQLRMDVVQALQGGDKRRTVPKPGWIEVN